MTELLQGFAQASHWSVLACIAAGAVIGIVVGVLPGIGPGVGISVLLPLTYGMSPLAGLAILLGVYCGAFYGGAVTSILIRTPGEASSIMTMFDGYPMARRGEAERALSLAFASAFAGGMVSALALALAAPPLAAFTGHFGAADNAAAIILALVCVMSAYRGRFLAAMTMVGAGCFVATVGIDPVSNGQRFTFGATDLMSGLPLVPIVVGLFGVAQALVLISSPAVKVDPVSAGGLRLKAFAEPLRYPGTLSKSVTLGTLIGVLPAAGAALSTSLAYFEARRASKNPDSFGKGNPEGIVAAEAANNSNSGGAMVTVLTLGIPGDAITAIIMGVFIVHGIAPGPNLFVERPELVYGVFASLVYINLAILAILVASTRWLAMFTRVDPHLLGVGILLLCFIGAYSTSNSMYSVWLALGAGVFGWLCAMAGMPIVPMVLGMVMGDALEASLRQALAVSGGSPAVFVERPVSAVLIALAALILFATVFRRRKARPVLEAS